MPRKRTTKKGPSRRRVVNAGKTRNKSEPKRHSRSTNKPSAKTTQKNRTTRKPNRPVGRRGITSQQKTRKSRSVTSQTSSRRKTSSNSYTRILTTATGRKLHASRTQIAFKTPSKTTKSITKANREKQISSFFNKNVRTKAEKFYANAKGKNKGNRFIIRVTTKHTVNGKRVNSGFSTRRRKVSTRAGFSRYMKDYERAFIKAMQTYIGRKNMKAIAFTGMTLEVVKEKKTRARTSKAKSKRS